MSEAKGKGRGFGGLRDLLPDVDAQLRRAQQLSKQETAADRKPTANALQADGGSPKHERVPTVDLESSKFPWGVLVAVGLFIGIFGLAAVYDRHSKSPVPLPDMTTAPSAPAPAAPAPVPRAEAPAVAPKSQPAPLKKSFSPDEVEVPRPKSVAPAFPEEERPPVGTDLLLNRKQIRYCLFEDVRVDAMSGLMNKHSSRDIDVFNDFVRDYNSRCSSFRYYPRDIDAVRSEVALHRGALQAQARYRVLSLR